jgi:mRNA-degrading endonuclease toxin of MazEF toxin-antitoxin module
LPRDCVVSLDNIQPLPHPLLVEHIVHLDPVGLDEVCSALRVAIDC